MHIRIIIADDHRVFIDGMSALLKDTKHIDVISEALNGEELIEKVKEYHPDVVLTDIQMPVRDGIEATREIMKLFSDIKVIALTMLNESFYIKKMLEAGAAGYLLKTVGKDELITAIEKVAAGEKYFAADVAAQLINNFSAKNEGHGPDLLTKREKEILRLIAKGLTDKEIAEQVFLSALTIITHRKNILSKLGLKNKVELARFAIDHGLID